MRTSLLAMPGADESDSGTEIDEAARLMSWSPLTAVCDEDVRLASVTRTLSSAPRCQIGGEGDRACDKDPIRPRGAPFDGAITPRSRGAITPTRWCRAACW